jgi:putative ATP-dependent endonuclease of the OLD family
MRIARIKIHNFRGIKYGELLLPKHAVLVGDNNSGKSTILEAIDLVLGPERLSKYPIIDEHDFYAGQYINAEKEAIEIKIEVIVVELIPEQTRHFNSHLEWWNENIKDLISGPPPEQTDQIGVLPALRIGFTGLYDKEDDGFKGSTYFLSPQLENGEYDQFRISDKRLCGFLFLRTLRTGSRALSLERGSLLDIILRLKEKRLKMWENVLEQLRRLSVTENSEIGINEILTSIQESIRSFVPSEWSDSPHIRISDLTRENLRKILTVFMSTGAKCEDGTVFSAPFQHQGTGTINMLVLALLTMIADLKQNVIFAMEEPEIAIPPHTQKQIVDNIKNKSAQALFTSHSPYVIEEFDPTQIMVLQRKNGIVSAIAAGYPPTVKNRTYRSELRRRFCEALFARRILITEGQTEYDSYSAVARRLHELRPDKFKSLEALGISIVNAETDSQISQLGKYYSKMGKTVFAVFDKQDIKQKSAIQAEIPNSYEAPEKGFEDIVLKGTAEVALKRFALALVKDGDWPPHLGDIKPTEIMQIEEVRKALDEYLKCKKGSGGAADLLSQCNYEEMPKFIVSTLLDINTIAAPPAKTSEITQQDQEQLAINIDPQR